METVNNNNGKIDKKDYNGQKLGAVDTNKDSNFSDEGYEFSGDAVRANPSRDVDKEVDLDRSGPRYNRSGHGEGENRGISSPTSGDGQQSYEQQEQQQAAGIPTQGSSRGERVSRRAGMNAGVEGIGQGSAQGYEGNTDDSGLPQDEDLDLSGTDEIDESDIEQSTEDIGRTSGSSPHVTHG